MFWSKNEKIGLPFYTQIYFIKVWYAGVSISRTYCPGGILRAIGGNKNTKL